MLHPSFELTLGSRRLAAWAHLSLHTAEACGDPGIACSHKRYPILRMSVEGRREVVWMRQGLIPAYAHDEGDANGREEAHVESLTCSSCYRSAFRRRRCVIPADHVTELQHGPEHPAGACALSLAGGGIFGLAGVWERWQNDSGHPVETFAVVTTLVARCMHRIADRMPVVIADSDQDRWLQTAGVHEQPLDLLRPLSAEELSGWRLSPCLHE